MSNTTSSIDHSPTQKFTLTVVTRFRRATYSLGDRKIDLPGGDNIFKYVVDIENQPITVWKSLPKIPSYVENMVWCTLNLGFYNYLHDYYNLSDKGKRSLKKSLEDQNKVYVYLDRMNYVETVEKLYKTCILHHFYNSFDKTRLVGRRLNFTTRNSIDKMKLKMGLYYGESYLGEDLSGKRYFINFNFKKWLRGVSGVYNTRYKFYGFDVLVVRNSKSLVDLVFDESGGSGGRSGGSGSGGSGGSDGGRSGGSGSGGSGGSDGGRSKNGSDGGRKPTNTINRNFKVDVYHLGIDLMNIILKYQGWGVHNNIRPETIDYAKSGYYINDFSRFVEKSDEKCLRVNFDRIWSSQKYYYGCCSTVKNDLIELGFVLNWVMCVELAGPDVRGPFNIPISRNIKSYFDYICGLSETVVLDELVIGCVGKMLRRLDKPIEEAVKIYKN